MKTLKVTLKNKEVIILRNVIEFVTSHNFFFYIKEIKERSQKPITQASAIRIRIIDSVYMKKGSNLHFKRILLPGEKPWKGRDKHENGKYRLDKKKIL